MTQHTDPDVTEFREPDPPDPGAFVELQAGILWIRLPIPGALRHINTWLVPGRRGWFLVDTGMRTDDVQAAWEALDRRLPLASGLESIVVTHHHPDHYGMARWLSERYGVGTAMTERAAAAAAAALQEDPRGRGQPSDGFAERLGIELDDDMRSILRGGIYRRIVSGQAPALPLADEVSGWTVTVHEGHAPGHACLFNAEARTLISGDQLLPTISSNVSLYPSNEHGDPLGDYLASLERLSALHAGTTVLPAHGRPFRTPHARIEALRQEHAARLERIRECCMEPRSTQQVAAMLFRLERLDALNRLLAVTETLAHLRRLELAGHATREGTAGTLRWRSN
ncbi:MAG: putative metallo-beta-lactamase family protein [Proteobacteria bacterium]|nr:putative metallo-beta-lactamase family protein [Pseudomonadota bacterium]